MDTAIRLKIGEVSKRTGVAVGALRYYESLALLKSERGENGYRYYDADAIRQVQFIKKAQALGFSLEDVGEILNAHEQGNVPCALVQSLLQEKIDQIESQIKEMNLFKQGLEQYRDSWTSTKAQPKPGDICPLIEAIPLN
ncbi:MAG: heavy metal-responsive transcriptional regulator [Cyanobacteria bacterium J06621_11]